LWKRTAADELPLQPVDGERLVEGPVVGAVEEVVRKIEEEPAELVIGSRKHLEEEAEVAADDGAVVGGLRKPEPLLAQEPADVVDRGDPVAQRLRLGPALRDREVGPLPHA